MSMGNPHSIIFVDDLDHMEPAFATVGPLMEKHPMFPQKVSVCICISVDVFVYDDALTHPFALTPIYYFLFEFLSSVNCLNTPC